MYQRTHRLDHVDGEAAPTVDGVARDCTRHSGTSVKGSIRRFPPMHQNPAVPSCAPAVSSSAQNSVELDADHSDCFGRKPKITQAPPARQRRLRALAVGLRSCTRSLVDQEPPALVIAAPSAGPYLAFRPAHPVRAHITQPRGPDVLGRYQSPTRFKFSPATRMHLAAMGQ